jgi:hypothetical protein
MVRVSVSWPGERTTHSVRAIRRTRFDLTRARAARAGAAASLDFLTIAGRSGGFSVTCTAPPPMTAPPAVQAQSFAKAIFTDIIRTLFQVLRLADQDRPNTGSRETLKQQRQKISLSARSLTILSGLEGRLRRLWRASVPIEDKAPRSVNEFGRTANRDYG